MPSFTLSINDMAFYAYHGYYAEEQKIGTWFLISVDVSVPQIENFDADELKQTINYEGIHRICKEVMNNKQKLIETVANNIYQKIHAAYPETEKVRVKLMKQNPPINKVGETAFEISDF